MKAKMFEENRNSEIAYDVKMPVEIAFNAIVKSLNEYMGILAQCMKMNTVSQNEFDEKSQFLVEALNTIKEKLFAPEVNKTSET